MTRKYSVDMPFEARKPFQETIGIEYHFVLFCSSGSRSYSNSMGDSSRFR